MLQIQGVKGEAVVVYCEPLITKEMGYHRLSRRVNKMEKKSASITLQRQRYEKGIENSQIRFIALYYSPSPFCLRSFRVEFFSHLD